MQLTWAAILMAVSVVSGHKRKDKNVSLYGSHGAAHGTFFDDKHMLKGPEQWRLSELTFYGCGQNEYMSGIALTYRNNDWNGPFDQVSQSSHGSITSSTILKQVFLAKGEYITELYYTTYRYKHKFSHRTAIGSFGIRTSTDQRASCGYAPHWDPAYHDVKDNYAFVYFTGSASGRIDQLNAFWVPKEDY